MSWYGCPHYERTRPIPVENGMKVKSKKGEIGETWWSHRFLEVLYKFQIGARLDRGRRYARKGQVISIDIEKCSVKAKVQGSAEEPYSVNILFEPIKERDWKRVERAMGSKAVFMAKLLSGEMPKNIEEAFAECSLSLFPVKLSEIGTECSCPDWSNPCKHIAAVYFILADRFDEDPFLLFRLRGRTKDEVIGYLEKLRPRKEEFVLEPIDDPGRFWSVGPEFENVQIEPRPPSVEFPILRMLGPLPLNGPINDRLKETYRLVSSSALEKANGK